MHDLHLAPAAFWGFFGGMETFKGFFLTFMETSMFWSKIHCNKELRVLWLVKEFLWPGGDIGPLLASSRSFGWSLRII